MGEFPEIQFAQARGGRIAYQRWGSGPATIVAVPPSAQNIEAGWERPEVRTMLERFGSFSDYLHFDKRGTGASDRTCLVPGIDERVDDLRAVMDDAGIERAHLFAQSEGGPMTLLFAATYPERVEGIILVGSAARMMDDDADWEASIAARTDFANRWGTPDSIVVDLFAPSMADDVEYRAWHQRYERIAASRDSILDLLLQMMDMDVREVLPSVDAPTLVMHRTGDRAMPIEMAREVVDLVPNAEFVELEGIDHFAYLGDLDSWMDRLERFVTGTVSPRPASKVPTPRKRVVIQTLGAFTVTVDDDKIELSEWGSKRARTLLKRLIVARGWPVTRDELADLLWPDESDSARLGARLSVQLSAVRRVLGGGIIADRQTVALDLDHVDLDTERILRAADDEQILAAYAGDFLPGERYEDWSTGMRDDLRHRFVKAGHALLATRLDEGNGGAAVEIALRLIEADAYDEQAHRSLARAYELSGDGAGARRARERAEHLWDD